MSDAKNMFIYDLPYVERKELCSILDMNNKWKELGGTYMKFSLNELERFRRAEMCDKSPTDRMLQEWGHQNNTILELFFFLWQMGHLQAMRAIKSCVPPEYHKLCESKQRFKDLFHKEGFNSTVNHSKPGGGDVSNGQFGGTRDVNHNHQQVREQIGSTGGATALPNPASKFGSANLNQATSLNRPQSTVEKVPEKLLQPASHGVSFSTVPKPIQSPSHETHQSPSHETHQSQRSQPVTQISKIMNNGRVNGEICEVSCEDNNLRDSLAVLNRKPKYDPLEDYNRKAEEKRAKILQFEAAAREEAQNGAAHRVNGSQRPSNNFTSPPQESATSNPHQYHPQDRERRISTASDASRLSDCGGAPFIPYKELEEATACWNRDNLLGRGGFGTVYKGVWKKLTVAVKKINLQGNADLDSTQLQISQTLDELKLLQSFPHDNILQIFGYSVDPDQAPCLVYQYMPNGSVEDRLQFRKPHGSEAGQQSGSWMPLNWYQRYNIALGTAKALLYLHTLKERPLIHGDVKSANILLDKNFEPKLGDFGLAREGKSQQSSMKVTRVHGTKPYLPFDYLRSKKLSVKVDTYSYGIVLFELCTGLRAYDDNRKEAKFLKELVEETSDEDSLRDQNLVSEPDGGIFNVLFKVAKGCVISVATRRPAMEKVFSDLKNFRDYMEEKNRARQISMGEPCPYQIQWQYDVAGRSGMTPVSPTTQSSIPMSLNPSQSSSVPPVYPNYQGNGYRFRPPLQRPPSNAHWKPEGANDPYHFGISNHPHDGRPLPKISINQVVTNGAVGGDPPPSYIEAVSPLPGGPSIASVATGPCVSPIPGNPSFSPVPGGPGFAPVLGHHGYPPMHGAPGFGPMTPVSNVNQMLRGPSIGQIPGGTIMGHLPRSPCIGTRAGNPGFIPMPGNHGMGALPTRPVIGHKQISPLIPQLSDLNINYNTQQNSSKHPSSGYSESDNDSGSSFGTSTTQNVVPTTNNPALREPSPYVNNRQEENTFIPLLTELGQPSAASKKSILD